MKYMGENSRIHLDRL